MKIARMGTNKEFDPGRRSRIPFGKKKKKKVLKLQSSKAFITLKNLAEAKTMVRQV